MVEGDGCCDLVGLGPCSVSMRYIHAGLRRVDMGDGGVSRAERRVLLFMLEGSLGIRLIEQLVDQRPAPHRCTVRGCECLYAWSTTPVLYVSHVFVHFYLPGGNGLTCSPRLPLGCAPVPLLDTTQSSSSW
jgi:hypothetical protein